MIPDKIFYEANSEDFLIIAKNNPNNSDRLTDTAVAGIAIYPWKRRRGCVILMRIPPKDTP